MASRRKRASKGFPPEYLALAEERDKWYRLAMLGTVVALLVIAVGTLFRPALFVAAAPASFVVYALVRHGFIAARAGKLLEPWIASHPYRGPAPKIVGPLRRLLLTHPVSAGWAISVVLFALIVLVLFGRHRFTG